MDSQEIRDKIMATINGIIKDDSDAATSNLHDVLAAKMRARINPESAEEPSVQVDSDVEVDTDLDDTDDLTTEE